MYFKVKLPFLIIRSNLRVYQACYSAFARSDESDNVLDKLLMSAFESEMHLGLSIYKFDSFLVMCLIEELFQVIENELKKNILVVAGNFRICCLLVI